MLYFGVDVDSSNNSFSEPVVDVFEKNTWHYDLIQRGVNSYREQMNSLIEQIESLVNYAEICYENREDKNPFGPDTLFQIKWCREYAVLPADQINEETHQIYNEYSKCVNVLFRAFLVSYKISHPVEYQDMQEKDLTITRYLFGIDPPATLEQWFREDSYYKILNHLYYKTLNVRDEMEYGFLL